jgi:hypothetical protein
MIGTCFSHKAINSISLNLFKSSEKEKSSEGKQLCKAQAVLHPSSNGNSKSNLTRTARCGGSDDLIVLVSKNSLWTYVAATREIHKLINQQNTSDLGLPTRKEVEWIFKQNEKADMTHMKPFPRNDAFFLETRLSRQSLGAGFDTVELVINKWIAQRDYVHLKRGTYQCKFPQSHRQIRCINRSYQIRRKLDPVAMRVEKINEDQERPRLARPCYISLFQTTFWSQGVTILSWDCKYYFTSQPILHHLYGN